MDHKKHVDFLTTTAIGGFFFLVPLVIIVVILGKAHRVMLVVAKPMADWIPLEAIGGPALANLIAAAALVLVCFLGGLLSSSDLASGFAKRLESTVVEKIPGYTLLKGMMRGLDPAGTSGFQTVLVQLDDAAQIGMEIERVDDGRVVVYLPGSPNPWSGTVLLLTPERVERLGRPLMAMAKHAQQVGKGTQALLSDPGAGARPEENRA